MVAYFHCCGTPAPPNINDDIELFPSQGGIAVEGDLEQFNGDSIRSVRSQTSGWRLSAPATWAELLATCFRITGQGLRRCSGRASVAWRSGEYETTGPIVRGQIQRPSGICRPRL